MMSSIPISRTKIIPPRRRAELFTRKRLLDTLLESLDKKLTLVSAPAGYGKTSLLIDLASKSEMPCCWLALDELDRDPQRFIAYLIAALTERFPKFGSQSLAVLNNLVSLEQDMEKMLVTLVNDIYEHINEHFILVLDDFHLVEGVEAIQFFLNRFVQLVDESCHLIISSRTLTNLYDLPLMVAREQVGGLSFSELAFLPEEVQALLLQNNNLRISDDEARKMVEETEGWITGLQFFGRRSATGSLIQPAPGAGVRLFDYLGQQVLDRQPPPLRDFLLRTSLLDEFDASLCEVVLSPLYEETQNWQKWIGEIIKNNLFALPVGADGRWIRYHHLFRDFLRTRLEQERPGEIEPILSRLARAYEDLGEWEKAHHIYKKLGDDTALAEMIERSSTTMLQRAHLTLETWLNEMPPSMLRTRPGLLAIRGAITCLKGNLHDGLNLLNQAEQIFRKENDIAGLTLTLARRATAHRFLGDYEASLRDADEVIQLSEFSDQYQILYAEALRVKGLALYRLGQARQAIEFLEHSLRLYVRLNDTNSVPVLLMETGMAYRAIGNYAEAENAYEKALQIWRQEGNLSWQASVLNNMGVLYHFQGKYEKAAFAFEEGMICARRSGYTRMEVLIAISLGDVYAELEDYEVAQQNYQHADELSRNMDDSFLLHSVLLSQANLAILKHEALHAHKIIDKVIDSIQSGDSLYEKGMLNLAIGRLSLAEGNAARAVEKIWEAQRCFSHDGRKLEESSSSIWLAAAFYQQGNAAKAAEIIASLLDSHNNDLSHPMLVAVCQSRRWLEGLQREERAARAMGKLLHRANLLTGELPAIRRQLRRQARVVQAPASHLSIQAFGQAKVMVGGRQLTLSDWQTQSVRDLFFYFLTASKPLTKEQIGAALWPEVEEPSKLKLKFKNEIYRLRRAVGPQAIIFEDIYYAFNHASDYEYDVEAFKSFLDRARSAADTDEQIEYYQKAVQLVRGPFLEDIYADWASIERAQLNQAYLSALLSLADLLQKKGRFEEALLACQRAVEYDPTWESAYSLSMQIHYRRGDRASIVKTYQACSEALQKSLGLPPSDETEALYRRLTE